MSVPNRIFKAEMSRREKPVFEIRRLSESFPLLSMEGVTWTEPEVLSLGLLPRGQRPTLAHPAS